MGLLYLWVFISIVYVTFAITAPLFEYYRIPLFNFIYLFLRTSCHQIPDRCFWIWESNMGLCAKCFGFYLPQTLILFFINKVNAYRNIKLLFSFSLILFLMMVVDSIIINFSNSNTMRFILGMLGGIGFALLLTQSYLLRRGKMDLFWRKSKLIVVMVIVIIFITSMYRVSAAQIQRYVKLRAGTPVMLEVVETIDSKKYRLGQTVPMVVSRAVKVDDTIVIFPGAEVYAKVAEVKDAGGWGAEGTISVIVESCFSVDEQEILISATQYSEGESKHGSATAVGVGTGLICLPVALTGFAVKGDEGKIPAGMTFKARVDTDYMIAVLDYDIIMQKQKEAQVKLKEMREKQKEQRRIEEEERKKKEERKKQLEYDPNRDIN